MSKEQPPRRSSHIDMPVAYAAVGASKNPDIVRFPPEGMTSYEEELRLGSGQERFLIASSLLMTWGAQRGSGIAVTDIVRGSGSEYVGPSFSGDGIPEAAGEIEEQFGPDGEPYLVAGTTAVLRADGQESRSVLVVYTVDEDRRVGFAWGTCDEAGAVGEQLFTIEQRPDDTVWAVARGFLAAPKNGILGLRGRADVRSALDSVKLQIEALAPGAQPTPDLGPGEPAPMEAESPAVETPSEAYPSDEPLPDPVAAAVPEAPAEPVADPAPEAPAAPEAEPTESASEAEPTEPEPVEPEPVEPEPTEPTAAPEAPETTQRPAPTVHQRRPSSRS